MRRTTLSLFVALIALFAGHRAEAGPVGTAFTYQGSLSIAGSDYNGAADFQFRLYGSQTLPGAQIGPTVPGLATPVNQGTFSVLLDFGASAFVADAERWLEIDVRTPAGAGTYSTLAPRQRLYAAPFAQYALGPWNTTANNELVYANNIGLGVSDPVSKIHVNPAIRVGPQTGYGLSTGITDVRDITLDYYRLGGPFNGTIWFHSTGAAVDDSEIQFWTKNTADPDQTKRMVIARDGKVGIGVFPPLEQLHVAGNVRIDGTLTTGTRTGYANYGPGSFHVAQPSTAQVARSFQRIGNIDGVAGPVVTNVMTDVNLPDGAMVNEVTIRYAQAGQVGIVLHVLNNNLGFLLDWVGTGTAGTQTVTVPITPYTVDNSTGPIRIRIYLNYNTGPSSPALTTYVENVRLRFTSSN